MLPFPLGYLQQQQPCVPEPVDWEAAAKQYSAYRAPSQQQQQQQQQQPVEDYGGKRKGAKKGSKDMSDEAAETDDVAPPDAPAAEEATDDLGYLLRQADQNPYSYEALQALVCALSSAGPDRLEDYEQALERFLFEFPLLFGYWKKFARLQCDPKGDWNKCEEVFERSLEFVGHNPLIWAAYFEWMKDFACLPPHLVRARMDQAIQHAGAHWKAWPLWQCILDWEEEELFAAREKIAAAELGAPIEEALGCTDTADGENPPKEGLNSLLETNRQRMQTALQRLRLLYSQLLRTPLESSDLGWERLKTLVERGSRSSIKSRRGPRPGLAADGGLCGDGGPIKGASTLFDVYDLLGDELLPQLLQRLQQQKSATLEELQLPAEADHPTEQPVAADPAAARAAIKERVSTLASLNAVDRECWQLLRETLDTTLEQAAMRLPFERAVSSSSSSSSSSNSDTGNNTSSSSKCSPTTTSCKVKDLCRGPVASGAPNSGSSNGETSNTHRWFWHPDPLAPRRLQAWREYLDFEEKHAPGRLELLQRRCLEVCASYPEFWLRCARQRRQQGPEEALKLLEFGATKILKRRRDMACVYASQLEVCGRLKEAAEEFEALVRPPLDAASMKYFMALLQFSLRHPPDTAPDGLSHALLLLQEAAEKYRDNAPCAELLHLYRAKLVAFHSGDTKQAL
ncbi:PRPF39 protein, related, related [Eimeria tenella]|uniref:PRPF39 protein, related, related n=1 Tax=Eimeria tenella TaxID=5802 RepID=U6L480_EIMTE|nr:PRPF39 protein, related, related [Eimeria tenella]CDJ45222.1 PRPF39 protein, related, related [Eimeria tenella]|eukprot:XP_013235969.1 PRPF39 protein, related, related [Eimeria tenella]